MRVLIGNFEWCRRWIKRIKWTIIPQGKEHVGGSLHGSAIEMSDQEGRIGLECIGAKSRVKRGTIRAQCMKQRIESMKSTDVQKVIGRRRQVVKIIVGIREIETGE
jgi:hypothetical protein